MMKIGYEEYDNWMELFKTMSKSNYWPNPNEIEVLENNPDLYIQFVCFLYECNDTPKNKEEKYSKKLLQKFIDTNLEFVDDDIYCDKMLQELMEQKGKK